MTAFIQRNYRRLYALGGLGVLLGSSLAWALAAARIEQGNADQLADGFLFQNAHTFHEALFPALHTLLFKWPLFWLMSAFHYSALAYAVATAGVVLVTVGALAYTLYRIDRRPLVFGTICLGLACVLTLVPAQISGRVASPLTMAMITGRNLEYVMYVSVLVIYVRAKGFRSWQWPAATLLLTLLFVSDQLFVPIGIGGSALLIIGAHLCRQRKLFEVARRWLVGSGLAWLLTSFILWAINRYVVRLVGEASGPSGLTTAWHNIWPATVYGVEALMLNMGITTAGGGLSVAAAFINLLLTCLIMAASYKLLRFSLARRNSAAMDTAQILSLMLLATLAVAIVSYVITEHPYQTDARYLTIALFAGFITLATQARSRHFKPRYLLAASGVLLLAVILGLISTNTHTNRFIASNTLRQRNQSIAAALKEHKVDLLIGDYWRVYPIKEMTPQAQQTVTPLASCFNPVASLRSNAWQKRLLDHSFAYLLSLRPSSTPFPQCSLGMVVFLYGEPSSQTVIAGNEHNPTELLLFYSDGSNSRPGERAVPPKPVFGTPTDGRAMPTGSTMEPLANPS